MKTYEILEAGHVFHTRRARTAENAIRAALRDLTIRACDYNCRRGDIVELEWTARATDSSEHATTLHMKVKAK